MSTIEQQYDFHGDRVSTITVGEIHINLGGVQVLDQRAFQDAIVKEVRKKVTTKNTKDLGQIKKEIKTTKDDLEAQITALKAELLDQIKETNSALSKLMESQIQVEEAQEKLRKDQTAIKKAQTTMKNGQAKTKAELDVHQAQLNTLNDKLTKLVTQVEDLDRAKDVTDKTIGDLTSKIDSFGRIQDTLVAKLRDQEQKVTAHTTALSELSRDMAGYISQLTDAQVITKEFPTLKDQLEALTKSVAKRIEDLQNKIDANEMSGLRRDMQSEVNRAYDTLQRQKNDMVIYERFSGDDEESKRRLEKITAQYEKVQQAISAADGLLKNPDGLKDKTDVEAKMNELFEQQQELQKLLNEYLHNLPPRTSPKNDTATPPPVVKAESEEPSKDLNLSLVDADPAYIKEAQRIARESIEKEYDPATMASRNIGERMRRFFRRGIVRTIEEGILLDRTNRLVALMREKKTTAFTWDPVRNAPMAEIAHVNHFENSRPRRIMEGGSDYALSLSELAKANDTKLGEEYRLDARNANTPSLVRLDLKSETDPLSIFMRERVIKTVYDLMIPGAPPPEPSVVDQAIKDGLTALDSDSSVSDEQKALVRRYFSRGDAITADYATNLVSTIASQHKIFDKLFAGITDPELPAVTLTLARVDWGVNTEAHQSQTGRLINAMQRTERFRRWGRLSAIIYDPRVTATAVALTSAIALRGASTLAKYALPIAGGALVSAPINAYRANAELHRDMTTHRLEDAYGGHANGGNADPNHVDRTRGRLQLERFAYNTRRASDLLAPLRLSANSTETPTDAEKAPLYGQYAEIKARMDLGLSHKIDFIKFSHPDYVADEKTKLTDRLGEIKNILNKGLTVEAKRLVQQRLDRDTNSFEEKLLSEVGVADDEFRRFARNTAIIRGLRAGLIGAGIGSVVSVLRENGVDIVNWVGKQAAPLIQKAQAIGQQLGVLNPPPPPIGPHPFNQPGVNVLNPNVMANPNVLSPLQKAKNLLPPGLQNQNIIQNGNGFKLQNLSPADASLLRQAMNQGQIPGLLETHTMTMVKDTASKLHSITLGGRQIDIKLPSAFRLDTLGNVSFDSQGQIEILGTLKEDTNGNLFIAVQNNQLGFSGNRIDLGVPTPGTQTITGHTLWGSQSGEWDKIRTEAPGQGNYENGTPPSNLNELGFHNSKVGNKIILTAKSMTQGGSFSNSIHGGMSPDLQRLFAADGGGYMAFKAAGDAKEMVLVKLDTAGEVVLDPTDNITEVQIAKIVNGKVIKSQIKLGEFSRMVLNKNVYDKVLLKPDGDLATEVNHLQSLFALGQTPNGEMGEIKIVELDSTPRGIQVNSLATINGNGSRGLIDIQTTKTVQGTPHLDFDMTPKLETDMEFALPPDTANHTKIFIPLTGGTPDRPPPTPPRSELLDVLAASSGILSAPREAMRPVIYKEPRREDPSLPQSAEPVKPLTDVNEAKPEIKPLKPETTAEKEAKERKAKMQKVLDGMAFKFLDKNATHVVVIDLTSDINKVALEKKVEDLKKSNNVDSTSIVVIDSAKGRASDLIKGTDGKEDAGGSLYGFLKLGKAKRSSFVTVGATTSYTQEEKKTLAELISHDGVNVEEWKA